MYTYTYKTHTHIHTHTHTHTHHIPTHMYRKTHTDVHSHTQRYVCESEHTSMDIVSNSPVLKSSAVTGENLNVSSVLISHRLI